MVSVNMMEKAHIGKYNRYNTWLQVLMSADSVWKINTLANTISKWSLLTWENTLGTTLGFRY